MLVAVMEALAPMLAKVESARYDAEIREKAVVPLPEPFRTFPVKLTLFPDIMAVAGGAAKGARPAGEAAGGEVVPKGAVGEGLAARRGFQYGVFHFAARRRIERDRHLFPGEGKPRNYSFSLRASGLQVEAGARAVQEKIETGSDRGGHIAAETVVVVGAGEPDQRQTLPSGQVCGVAGEGVIEVGYAGEIAGVDSEQDNTALVGEGRAISRLGGVVQKDLPGRDKIFFRRQ